MDQTGVRFVSFFVIENTGQEVLVSPVLDALPMFIIGSDARNPLRLDDPSVASAHAMVSRKEGEEYFIQPRYRDAVVSVNGKRVNALTRLKPGDITQIGETRLRFEQEERRAQVPPGQAAIQVSNPVAAMIPARATSLVRSAPIPREIAPVGERVIYRPKRAKESQSGGYLRLTGLIAVGVVVLLVGYYLITILNTTTVEARPIDYAFDDGNVAVLMFSLNGCEDCGAQESMVTQVMNEFRGDVYLQSYNLSRPGNESMIEKFQLVTVPTVIVLDDKGVVFAVFSGGTDEATLDQAFQLALQQSANN